METQIENQKEQIDDNLVYIGKKEFMNYVNAITVQLAKGTLKEVIIKARGKFTGRAIDVVELSRRILRKNDVETEVKNVKIGSEEFDDKEKNKKVHISIIEITISKK